MEFIINRDAFLKALGHANGIIEKKINTSYFIKRIDRG